MKAAVLTVSDTRTEDDDASGDLLVGLLTEFGATVLNKRIVRDDESEIRNALIEYCDGGVDLVITTGGTGFSPRDVTPEATLSVIERQVPGIAEAMRRETAKNTPMAMLSRGVCGIRGKTLIVNLPGSPKAVAECFEVIRHVLNHAVEVLSGGGEHDEE